MLGVQLRGLLEFLGARGQRGLLRRRTGELGSRLLLRLPQLEQESSLPLIQQHITLLPPLDATGTGTGTGTVGAGADLGAGPSMGLDAAYLTSVGMRHRGPNPEALSVPTLEVKRSGGVVQVTIDRASHANAYNSEMLSALERLVPTHRAHTLSARSTPHCMLVPSCHCRAYVHERMCVCVCCRCRRSRRSA